MESSWHEDGEGALGGFMACAIGIEAEDDIVGVALEQASVVLGEGGAEGGDGILNAIFVANDGIDLAFTDEGEFIFSDVPARFIEAEKNFRFIEKLGLRGIDVFAAIGVGDELATAEGDDVSVVVKDREHESISEADKDAGAWVAFILK